MNVGGLKKGQEKGILDMVHTDWEKYSECQCQEKNFLKKEMLGYNYPFLIIL